MTPGTPAPGAPAPGLPAVVERVLADFVAAARSAFADDLVSVVLFGSAAEGRLREALDDGRAPGLGRRPAPRPTQPPRQRHELRFLAPGLSRALPPALIRAVHLAGGRWIGAGDGTRRLLDDHLHDVPDPVFALLTEVAQRAPRDLTVILERDGACPAMETLLGQLEKARAALREGRARPQESVPWRACPPAPPGRDAQVDEAFLARLYTDAELRGRVLADPSILPGLDRVGLELAVGPQATGKGWTNAIGPCPTTRYGRR